jgi:hypothetical protein
MRTSKPLEERLTDQLVRRPNGCLEWTGHTVRGYGQILNSPEAIAQGRPRQIGTHRAAWELVHGPVPDGFEVRHKECANPPCCDVNHLAIGTAKDNAEDRARDGRWQHWAVGRETCKAGHTYGPDDVQRGGKARLCKKCAKERKLEWQRRDRAAKKAVAT